jgi:TPR repeat protein
LYRSNDLKEVDPHRDKNQLAVLVNEVDSTGMKLMLSLWHVIEASSTYEQSTEPLMERAQQGDPVAEYQLAMRYRDGAYDVNRDPEKSMSWLRRSAADGNRIAIQDLERVQE